jgi:hypothetical protein
MSEHTEQHLAELIGALPPAPTGWVRAAQELPAARAAIDGLVERSLADIEQRKVVLADLEAALRENGVEPRQQLVDELRSRLRDA